MRDLADVLLEQEALILLKVKQTRRPHSRGRDCCQCTIGSKCSQATPFDNNPLWVQWNLRHGCDVRRSTLDDYRLRTPRYPIHVIQVAAGKPHGCPSGFKVGQTGSHLLRYHLRCHHCTRLRWDLVDSFLRHC